MTIEELIVEYIDELHEAKRMKHKVPAEPNELELMQTFRFRISRTLDRLIETGYVEVHGRTINKDRILSINKQKIKDRQQ